MVLVILPVRVIALTFNKDQAAYNLGICKIEYYALYVTRTTSAWLIVLACINRYFHSSAKAHMRQMSSLKTTRIMIAFVSIIVLIIHCHMFIYYELSISRDRFGNLTSSCSAQKGIFSTFLGLWNMFLYSLCPCSLMLLFGLLTLNNLRQYRRAIPVAIEAHRITRRTDAQLLRMLTAQVLITIIATLPLSIQQLYVSFTSSLVKDTLRIAQENLAARIVGTMTYFAHSSSLYLYTLTGTVFRKEFFKIIKQCCHLNQNHVASTTDPIHAMSHSQRSQRTANILFNFKMYY